MVEWFFSSFSATANLQVRFCSLTQTKQESMSTLIFLKRSESAQHSNKTPEKTFFTGTKPLQVKKKHGRIHGDVWSVLLVHSCPETKHLRIQMNQCDTYTVWVSTTPLFKFLLSFHFCSLHYCLHSYVHRAWDNHETTRSPGRDLTNNLEEVSVLATFTPPPSQTLPPFKMPIYPFASKRWNPGSLKSISKNPTTSGDTVETGRIRNLTKQAQHALNVYVTLNKQTNKQQGLAKTEIRIISYISTKLIYGPVGGFQ